MKRIYIFSYYFPPLGRAVGVLTAYFARHLSDLGWRVCVLTTGSYQSALFGGQQDASLEKILPKNIKIVRATTFLNADIGAFLYTCKVWKSPFHGWRIAGKKYFAELFEGEGVVYAPVPLIDVGMLAYDFAQQYKLPLIIDFKDDCHHLPGKVVKSAACILASNPISLENMHEYYSIESNKCHVFYNGTCDKIESPPLDNRARSNSVNFAFAGTINKTTRPEFLVKAANAIAKHNPSLSEKISVSVFGPKSYYYYLYLKPHLGKKAIYGGFIESYEGLLNYLNNNIDVGVCSFNEKWKYGISSKTFTYMACGLPLLAYGPEGGALHRFIEENHIGLFSKIGDMDALIENIKRLAVDDSLRLALSHQVRKIAPEYTMEQQVIKIEKYFNEAMRTFK